MRPVLRRWCLGVGDLAVIFYSSARCCVGVFWGCIFLIIKWFCTLCLPLLPQTKNRPYLSVHTILRSRSRIPMISAKNTSIRLTAKTSPEENTTSLELHHANTPPRKYNQQNPASRKTPPRPRLATQKNATSSDIMGHQGVLGPGRSAVGSAWSAVALG